MRRDAFCCSDLPRREFAPFWATPGGALDAGEDFASGARRELCEETGIDADCGHEIARRIADFVTLEGVPVSADERYFLVRTDRPEDMYRRPYRA